VTGTSFLSLLEMLRETGPGSIPGPVI
jgi:hypothetical protein